MISASSVLCSGFGETKVTSFWLIVSKNVQESKDPKSQDCLFLAAECKNDR